MSSQLTNSDKGRVKTRRFNKKIHVREKRREALNYKRRTNARITTTTAFEFTHC